MQFDVAKLPEKKPLSLCEMITLLAWGEAVTAKDLETFGPPSERAYQDAWDAQVEECCRQAGADPAPSSWARR